MHPHTPEFNIKNIQIFNTNLGFPLWSFKTEKDFTEDVVVRERTSNLEKWGLFYCKSNVGMLYFTAHALPPRSTAGENDNISADWPSPSRVVDVEDARRAQGIVHIVIRKRKPGPYCMNKFCLKSKKLNISRSEPNMEDLHLICMYNFKQLFYAIGPCCMKVAN